MAEHKTHDSHDHTHGPGCGHKTIEHDGHTDYLHDGHLHAAHEGHYDEHGADVAAAAEHEEVGTTVKDGRR